jgi:hypothetical protein
MMSSETKQVTMSSETKQVTMSSETKQVTMSSETKQVTMSSETKQVTKQVTMSMFRANKILIKLRDLTGDTDGKITRHSECCTSEDATVKYGTKTSYITWDKGNLEDDLEEIRVEFNDKLSLYRLTELWRCQLFSLSIEYGMHAVLSTIDYLKTERYMLNEVLQTNKRNKYKSIDEVDDLYKYTNSMGPLTVSYQVGAFNSKNVKERIRVINRKISELDNTNDMLNIQNSFIIDLNPKQCYLLNIDFE